MTSNNLGEIVEHLMTNLPKTLVGGDGEPLQLDIILDGGAFNGSYLVGALMFLKAMENKGIIKVRRISGASIGSLCGFLYFANALEFFEDFYNDLSEHFRTHYDLDKVQDFKKKMHALWDLCEQDLPQRLFYVSYWNIKRGEKVVVNKYKSVSHMVDTIIASSFVPFIINGSMSLNGRIDGFNPYIFPVRGRHHRGDHRRGCHKQGVRILYLNLFGSDKLGMMWNIKNEVTNYQRLLAGMLEMQGFFIKEAGNSLCSYVDEWWFPPSIQLWQRYLLELIAVTVIRLIWVLWGWIGWLGWRSVLMGVGASSKKINRFHKCFALIINEIVKLFIDLLCF